MARLGNFLLGTVILGFLVWATHPVFMALFNVTNSTWTLSSLDQVTWRGIIPVGIPLILAVLLVLMLVGKVSFRDEDRGEF